MSNLTPEQQERLNAARKARNEPIKSSFKIDRSAYELKLKNSLEEDSKLIKEIEHKNRARALEEWSNRVGPRWANAIADDPAIVDRVERLKLQEGTHKTSILAVGRIGVGKTWQAYAYAGSLIREGILTSSQIYIATEASIAFIVRAGFSESRQWEEIFDPKHKMFIFDDIGQANYGKDNAAARQAIWHEILNYIYSHRFAMAMTTNLSITEQDYELPNRNKIRASPLAVWLGDAAFSRLQHVVGDDGIIAPGDKNMREKVFKDWERQYLKGKQ